MRKLIFSPNGWLDYIYWQKSDKTVQIRIDELSKEICLDPYSISARPVKLKFEMSEVCTRKINFEHRLVLCAFEFEFPLSL